MIRPMAASDVPAAMRLVSFSSLHRPADGGRDSSPRCSEAEPWVKPTTHHGEPRMGRRKGGSIPLLKPITPSCGIIEVGGQRQESHEAALHDLSANVPNPFAAAVTITLS